MVKQHGGNFEGGRDHGSQSGGGRKSKGKRRQKNKSRRRVKKGGEGILATAAVPFGLLALQRYFKGSKTSKRGIHNLGNSFKRTFRRRR